MRVYPERRYIAGDYKDTCQRCGWDYLRSELTKETRTGAIVCRRCLDPIHPCDEPKHRVTDTIRKRD